MPAASPHREVTARARLDRGREGGHPHDASTSCVNAAALDAADPDARGGRREGIMF